MSSTDGDFPRAYIFDYCLIISIHIGILPVLTKQCHHHQGHIINLTGRGRPEQHTDLRLPKHAKLTSHGFIIFITLAARVAFLIHQVN